MRGKVPPITPNLTAPGGLLKSLEGLELSCGTHRAPALTTPHPGENQPQNSDVHQWYKPQIPHGLAQEKPGPIRGKFRQTGVPFPPGILEWVTWSPCPTPLCRPLHWLIKLHLETIWALNRFVKQCNMVNKE